MKNINIVTTKGDVDLHLYKLKLIASGGETCIAIFKDIIKFFEKLAYTDKICVTENNDWYMLTRMEFNSKEEFYSYLKSHNIPFEVPKNEYCGKGHSKVVISLEKIF